MLAPGSLGHLLPHYSWGASLLFCTGRSSGLPCPSPCPYGPFLWDAWAGSLSWSMGSGVLPTPGCHCFQTLAGHRARKKNLGSYGQL